MATTQTTVLPIEVCRVCEYPTGDCTCPVETESALIVADEAARDVREYLREHPELQTDEYDTDSDEDPLLGLCYPAAEAWYHLRDCEPDVYCLSWSDVNSNLDGTHWYLREPDDGRFIDLALPVESPTHLPPFEQGTRRGFITGDEPSNRAKQVLEAVR